MKKSIGLSLVTLATVSFLLPATVLAQRKATGPSAADGVKLEYKFPDGKTLAYTNSMVMNQSMDYNGQTMQANVNTKLSCTVTGKGLSNNGYKLEIQIDTMLQNVESPQGSDGGFIQDAMGKTFVMTLGPDGKVIDLSDAEKIVIRAQSAETNAAQSFADYFPRLPQNLMKPGDEWPGKDTVSSKSGTFSQMSIISSRNKFEGIEKIDGIECAKITSEMQGTRQQTASTMGMDVSTNGTFTGTNVLYFAVKEGYYVRRTTTTKLAGTIEITGPQNLSMPLVADISSVSYLKK